LLDRGLACIDRENLRAAPRGFYVQVAHPAAGVENAAMHERPGGILEWVQREIAARNLLLEIKIMAIRSENAVEQFIERWQSAGGSERANYQLFVHELCTLLELPTPDPAREDTRDNAYVFERRVTFRHGDGTESPGFIDC